MMFKNKALIALVVVFLVLLSGCFIFDKSKNKGKLKTMSDRKKTIFTFLSAPGGGKGTLAKRCEEELNFLVLSTGDLFRQHIANKTSIGLALSRYISKGQLVPDDFVVKMVKEWLVSRKDSDRPIILDGFPRTVVQAQKLLEIIQRNMKEHVFRVIKLEISQNEIIQRLVNRRVCSNKECQSVYNTSMPEIAGGKCPKCGAKLIQRKDDQPDVIAERFKIYNKHEKELVDFYESEGLEVETLNVAKKKPEEILEDFKKII